MKQIYTLTLSLLTTICLQAQSPTVDGAVNTSEGYTLIATADEVAGWNNVNARKLYMAQDATNYYLAATFNADDWMSYGFIINAIPLMGGTSDGWARQINYTHAQKPDVEIRGNLDNSWAEAHVWNGTSWSGTGTNIGPAAMSNLTSGGSFGAVEVMIPKAMTGSVTTFDIQFYITGNNNDHGSFDAIPNDNNAQGWTPPASITNLSQYVTVNTIMNISLKQFTGTLSNGNVNLNWSIANPIDAANFQVQFSTDAQSWKTLATVVAEENKADYTFNTTMQGSRAMYRLLMLDKSGKQTYSNIVLLRTDDSRSVQLLNNPVRNAIRFSFTDTEKQQLQVVLYSMEGKQIVARNFQHQGGYTVFSLDNKRLAPGTYILNVMSAAGKSVHTVLVQ